MRNYVTHLRFSKTEIHLANFQINTECENSIGKMIFEVVEKFDVQPTSLRKIKDTTNCFFPIYWEVYVFILI